MIRSLIAVLIAVFVGLTTAKFIEGVGTAAYPFQESVPAGDVDGLKAAAANAPFGYKAILIAGWAVAAFVSALISLVIGKRWAPLGWLSSGLMFFLAIITLIGTPLGFWVLPAALIVTGGGGWLAIKLLKATNVYPVKNQADEFFHER